MDSAEQIRRTQACMKKLGFTYDPEFAKQPIVLPSRVPSLSELRTNGYSVALRLDESDLYGPSFGTLDKPTKDSFLKALGSGIDAGSCAEQSSAYTKESNRYQRLRDALEKEEKSDKEIVSLDRAWSQCMKGSGYLAKNFYELEDWLMTQIASWPPDEITEKAKPVALADADCREPSFDERRQREMELTAKLSQRID
jgi:hypothetical protein